MIWIYAVLVGFVAAGFTGSLWTLASGEPPRLAALGRRNLALPVALAAFVIHWPVRLLELGCLRLAQGRAAGLAIIAAGLAWCFFQGVFILTRVFGVA